MSRILGRDDVTRPLGVIDTLSAGYETINRRLWLLAFPIGLDLLFWLGPKLSVVLLAGYLPLRALSSEQISIASDALAHFNLLFLLALYVPSVLGRAPYAAPPGAIPFGGVRPVFHVMPIGLLAAALALLPIALLLAALYLGSIGRLVLPAPEARWPSSAGRVWGRLLLLHGAGLAAVVAIGAPWVVLIALSSAIGGEVSGFLVLLFQVALLWGFFYFFFAADATILRTGLNPMRAAFTSVGLIQAHFWPAVGLIGLTFLIENGLSLVWRALSGQPLGLVASIFANAYVGTGLVAAGMLFYRDRLGLK